jgi:hypothetical protein
MYEAADRLTQRRREEGVASGDFYSPEFRVEEFLMTNSDLSPGDVGDPVADSIRAQQNQDAMPHPSELEQALECEECGEKSDDVERRSLVIADCRAAQQPEKTWTVLCDDCDEERQPLREQQRETAQKRLQADYYDDPIAIAFYECGQAKFITGREQDDEAIPPQMEEAPAAPIHCQCGEPIADVELIDDDSGDRNSND